MDSTVLAPAQKKPRTRRSGVLHKSWGGPPPAGRRRRRRYFGDDLREPKLGFGVLGLSDAENTDGLVGHALACRLPGFLP